MRKTILTIGSALLFLGALTWAPSSANARGRNDGAGNEREDRGPSILERLLQREGEDADDGGKRGRVESDDDMDEGGGRQRGGDSDDDGGGRRERSSRDEL